MAQKTGKENTELKVVAETITQCVNCGVIGIPVSKNMCQKCFTATSAAGASKHGEKSPRSRSSPERTSDRAESSRDLKRGGSIAGIDDGVKEGTFVQLPVMVVVVKREVNRCSGCRRKVGLTGFRCRCDELFCGDHRYSDRHDCSYDYKAAGRDAIARENPMIKMAETMAKNINNQISDSQDKINVMMMNIKRIYVQ